MTNYLDDDRPRYEFHHELDGLRRQNDQLRMMIAELRGTINSYRTEAEEAKKRMRQMEEARAGITGARLFFHRSDAVENVVLWHYTIDGVRSVCRARIDPVKYELTELPAAPEGLCDRCAQSLEIELKYNPYEERDIPAYGNNRRRKTIEQENEQSIPDVARWPHDGATRRA